MAVLLRGLHVGPSLALAPRLGEMFLGNGPRCSYSRQNLGKLSLESFPIRVTE